MHRSPWHGVRVHPRFRPLGIVIIWGLNSGTTKCKVSRRLSLKIWQMKVIWKDQCFNWADRFENDLLLCLLVVCVPDFSWWMEQQWKDCLTIKINPQQFVEHILERERERDCLGEIMNKLEDGNDWWSLKIVWALFSNEWERVRDDDVV